MMIFIKNLKKYFRKIAPITSIVFVMCCSFSSSAKAEDGLSAPLLAEIRNYTQKILAKINDAPEYVKFITLMALSWIDTDTKPTAMTAVNGSLFALLATTHNADLQAQINQTKDMTLTFLGKDNKFPNINDFSYTALLGIPLTPPTKLTGTLANNADSYMQYVSGARLPLAAPDPKWKTQGQDRQDYYTLYTTVAAIQSYNNYVISKIYTERQQRARYPDGIPHRKKGDPASTQDILAVTVENASTPEWYANIAAESLGLVLRQILVFNSQNYVLLQRMLDTQQDMLMAQAMTNTLLMESAGLGQGRLLYKQAAGTLGQ